MKKVIMSLLVGLLCVPAIAHAADDKFATISDISKADSVTSGTGESLDVVITGKDTKDVLVEYGKEKTIKLKKLDDSAPDRPDNKAWLGVHPDTSSIGDITKAQVKFNNGEAQNVDPNDLDYYLPVTEDAIKKAIDAGKEYIEYKLEFDWDGNKTYEQTVTIRIYVQKLEVAPKDEDTDAETWTPEDTKAYQEKVEAERNNQEINQTPDKQKPNADENALDDVPKTGDTTSVVVFIALALSLVGGYSLKLAYSKK